MDEIVHIIPIKHEIDRAVRPFEKLRANKIYLLHSKSKKFDIGPKYFLETVKKRLEHKNIEIITIESDIGDPLPLLSTISDIIVPAAINERPITRPFSALDDSGPRMPT